ncbi:MAG: response regulator, partial [Acidimicrobiia bacterium]
GMTGLLLDSDLDPEQRDYAETVRSSAEGLLAILNDILDFSKIEAGGMELEEIDFDVAAVAEEVAEMLAPNAHAKGLEIIVDIDPALPELSRGDAGRLRQVLVNLVGNAIKFTGQGSVEVSVRSVRASDKTEVRFEVRDTGIGIPEEAQQRLFDSFTQADAATTRRFGGTGLGLAISKRIVELMGGDIGVESAPGRGSTFWFVVPLAPSRSPVPPKVTSLKGLRALVVDDIPSNCASISAQLALWGMTSDCARSGAEALAILSRSGTRYDVVLSDFQMPGMDGVELADAIVATMPAPPPVLVLSSAGGRESARHRDTENVGRFLVKPARRAVLLDAITSAIGASPGHQALEERGGDGPAPVGRGRVLVVDDNTVNQRLAAILLQKSGYRVDSVGNGAEAVQAAQRVAYDAILMDCEMPVMDGYSAAREIRRHEAGTKHTPIIAVTASVLADDINRALAAGMDAHVAKPIDRRELLHVLTGLMGERPVSPRESELDMAVIEELRALDDDGSGFRSLVSIFLREAPRRLEQLLAAASEGDTVAIREAAHSLRGSAATFGASRLAKLAQRIEEDARAGQTPPRATLDEVELSFQSAVEVIESIAGNGSGAHS